MVSDLHRHPPMTLARLRSRHAWILPVAAVLFTLLVPLTSGFGRNEGSQNLVTVGRHFKNLARRPHRALNHGFIFQLSGNHIL